MPSTKLVARQPVLITQSSEQPNLPFPQTKVMYTIMIAFIASTASCYDPSSPHVRAHSEKVICSFTGIQYKSSTTLGHGTIHLGLIYLGINPFSSALKLLPCSVFVLD